MLEFPLTEIFENRDYAGSNHFFFDIGNGNLLAFFDLPGLDLGPYAEVLGGLHHIAISVTREKWEHLRGKLEAAGVEYVVESETSIYFRDPDGARLELLADPLGEMLASEVAAESPVARARTGRRGLTVADEEVRGHRPGTHDEELARSWFRARTAGADGSSPVHFPLILSIRSVAPALALGNAVLLKPDPRTTVSAAVSPSCGSSSEAGLPDGLLQLLPVAGTRGEAAVDGARGAGRLVHRLDAGGTRGGRARPRSTSSGRTSSSAATTHSSSCPAPTSRRPSRRAPSARSCTRVRSA